MSNTKKELSEMTFEKRVELRNNTAKELNEQLRKLGKNEFTQKRIEAKVGGGTQVGDKFTLTGEVTIGEIQGSKNVFLAVKATTGETIPLKALILQSVSGYDTKGVFIDELEPMPKNADDKTKEAHKADENYHEYRPTFDSDVAGGEPASVVSSNKDVLNHGTRSDIELYGLIKQKLWDCKGLQLTYCGKVYRTTTASKNYDFGELEVKKGARRAMAVSVWKIEKPAK